MKQRRRVVVFGIFDGVHEGHRAFFRQAKTKGDELVCIVGRDAVCALLKQKTPRHTEQERVELVKREAWVDDAVLGDHAISTYEVLSALRPDVVCFGYDQKLLRNDFERWAAAEGSNVEIHALDPFEPDVYHTSLLRSKKKH